jgi:hypothetical protein
VLKRFSVVIAMHGRALSWNSCAPNGRSTFEVYASKLVKASKRWSGDGYVCRTHHFITKTMTLNYRCDKCLNRYGNYVEK